uniref:Uncharacterized protein n=1 Tax=Anguilla anguilla TaxID=7936 RepID=A0A0E9SVV0_ANGAN
MHNDIQTCRSTQPCGLNAALMHHDLTSPPYLIHGCS